MSEAPTLYTKNRGLALRIAQNYFFPDGDQDDVRQEALIGLWEAVRRYDPARGRFTAFATVVIRYRLEGKLDRARSGKQRFLNEAVPLDAVTTAAAADPTVQQVIDRDRLRTCVETLRRLTPLEREALRARLGGSYSSRDRRLENGLNRARAKLTEALS